MRTPLARIPAWKRVFGGAFYLLFCLLAMGLGTVGSMIRESPILGTAFIEMVHPTSPPDKFNANTLTLLVLGCDEDLAPGGKKVLRKNARSDMMLVVKLDFLNKRIGGISIPRDLEVALPGYRGQKINAYHSIGGNDLAKQAAEQVLGIPIDRVIELNYDAFQEMVDMVGGVDIYIPKDMKYTDKAGGLFINFKKGRQHLNGYDAMCFVRFRHSDSDFLRMERQRDFMLSFKGAVLKNWGLIGPLATKATEVLGGGMQDDELIVLSNFVKSVPGDCIKMANLPIIEGSGTNLQLDIDKLPKALSDNYLTDAPFSLERVSYH